MRRRGATQAWPWNAPHEHALDESLLESSLRIIIQRADMSAALYVPIWSVPAGAAVWDKDPVHRSLRRRYNFQVRRADNGTLGGTRAQENILEYETILGRTRLFIASEYAEKVEIDTASSCYPVSKPGTGGGLRHAPA